MKKEDGPTGSETYVETQKGANGSNGPKINRLIYVVTAYRFGDRESHSYVVGAFDNEVTAITQARLERDWRGGKYECEVRSMELNESLKYKNYNVVLALPKLHPCYTLLDDE
jgi:hypothetical protein